MFFRQSILERMVGSGDLVIESAGEIGRQDFSNVRKPSAVQNEIYKQMEANENRKFDRVNAGPATPPIDPRADRPARRPPPAGRAQPGRVRPEEAAAPRPDVRLRAATGRTRPGMSDVAGDRAPDGGAGEGGGVDEAVDRQPGRRCPWRRGRARGPRAARFPDGAGGERAAAEAPDAAVDPDGSRVDGREGVGDGEAARVVQVHADRQAGGWRAPR